jgi:hypothetical protein
MMPAVPGGYGAGDLELTAAQSAVVICCFK